MKKIESIVMKRVSLIIVGIVAIILSIIVFNKSTGYYESSKEYGGDAYTGIQQASAQSANNTQQLAEITKFDNSCK